MLKVAFLESKCLCGLGQFKMGYWTARVAGGLGTLLLSTVVLDLAAGQPRIPVQPQPFFVPGLTLPGQQPGGNPQRPGEPCHRPWP